MILDTNALSAFADNDLDLLSILPSDRPWALPVIVIGEYRFGLLGSREKDAREEWLDRLISVVTVLEITERTASFYATIRHQLRVDQRKIPPNDSWIAALAMEHQWPIASRDGHFDVIHGIRRIAW
ncbi:MAG: PIN domain-containing protein [Verrucomicrobiae bacterium]|nr:PIN domain-containing protein [Verrucomicrobiae bacterium]